MKEQNMRVDYDVIIAGAGPGGSTAAYELARRGVRVGVFEKQRLPRAKPCGGCLSLKIDRILAPDFHALIDRCFLTKGERQYHDCAHSRLTSFAHGLSTVNDRHCLRAIHSDAGI
jgi:flavin-dependent dehydrogenase